MEQRTSKIRVLNEEPFMLKPLARMLASLGHTAVSICDKGHVALKMIGSQNAAPDPILPDINMPEMDGIEFVRRLVEWRWHSGTP